jgi:hypothetical protein
MCWPTLEFQKERHFGFRPYPLNGGRLAGLLLSMLTQFAEEKNFVAEGKPSSGYQFCTGNTGEDAKISFVHDPSNNTS